MFEQIFQKSRFLIVITVVVSLLSSLILYVASISIIAHILMDFFSELPAKPNQGQVLAVSLLKALDILLIALTFQMVAIAIYRLFISSKSVNESRFLTVLGIANFHDLKVNILQVSIIILVILFLEQAVEIGATLDTLLYGASIAMVVWAIVAAIKSLRH